MTIDIVLVNYNRGDFTENCIRSLLNYRPFPEMDSFNFDYNLIIVDNNSSDNHTQELLLNIDDIVDEYQEAPIYESLSVDILNLSENVGCGRARNLGAEQGDGDVILFVDNDVEFRDNWLTGILQGFAYKNESENLVGVVGLKTLDLLGLITGGGYSDPKNLTKMRGWKKSRKYLTGVDSVTYVSGAFLATYRDVFELVGGFSPQFFFWYEDSDYCMKVKKELNMMTVFNGHFPQIHHCQGGNKPDFILDHLEVSRAAMRKKWGVA